VLLDDFVQMVPPNFSLYIMASTKDRLADAKLCYPKVGFRNDNEAVLITRLCSSALKRFHDIFARQAASITP
jgi:hypothetical protein